MKHKKQMVHESINRTLKNIVRPELQLNFTIAALLILYGSEDVYKRQAW